MREQVITPRVSNRKPAAAGRARTGDYAQRPARRASGVTAPRKRDQSGLNLIQYLPLAGKIALAVIIGVLVFMAYRSVTAASFFQVRSIDVMGTARTPNDQVKAIVRRLATPTGVWNADLAAISKELKTLPWVRSAVVTRSLPDGLRVRIEERLPLAVVRTGAGKFMWVDRDAVMLGLMAPADKMPSFFIRGWDEAESNDARMDNKARIEKYLELSGEWEKAGLSERVSEVNLLDVRDVRAQLAGEDSHIEVRVGGQNFGARLGNALKYLDEQRGTSLESLITYLDAAQDKKVIVGTSTSPQVVTEMARKPGALPPPAAPNTGGSSNAPRSNTPAPSRGTASAGARKEPPKNAKAREPKRAAKTAPRR